MKPLRRLRHLIHIGLVLLRYRLDEIVTAVQLFRSAKLMVNLVPGRQQHSDSPRGMRIRLALEELGPVFVKFGQVLSTRRDLIPPDIADELALLQDQVPPFSGEQAREIIERELGAPVSELFRSFDATPLASASIAQVHAAELPDGREVVVKVVRPDIAQQLQRDLDLINAIASVAERYWEEGHRVRPTAVVKEFETVIFDELDMQREAANASLLRRNFAGSTDVYIPEIHWNYCGERVLVMERVHGIPVKDTARLKAEGFNLERLAKRGVRLFYTMVFRDNLFHADMHPGNILVNPDNPDDPSFIALDFGIVCSLTPTDLHYIGENFLAIFNQEYRRVAELHVEAGWVPADTRIDEMEAAVRTVCEANFTRPLNEISFGHLLGKLFQVARRFKLSIQPQLIMLQKTLLNIEGLGRDLHPQLDIWAVAKPELEAIMRQQYSLPQVAEGLLRRLPDVLEKTPEMPTLVHRYLKQAAHGELRTQIDPNSLQQWSEQQEQRQHSQNRSIISAGALIAAALLFPAQEQLHWQSVNLWLSIGFTVLALRLFKRR
ncbi:MAG: ubiquinone biosynthesis regulatory protein kinase UbiB [Xanthomonadales bacterium]|nr:ubiquinone biosynthesis regulatory protein kinase UbiB [Xanthomonadales bacterium]